MSTTTTPYAVILVPTYNERNNIGRLVELVDRVLVKIKNWKVDLLVIDDSSPDGTADVVRDLQKKYSFVKLVVNKQKSGLGGAYLRGMDEAFNKMGADAVFEMDADLSHDPKKIPAFLAALDGGADMVLGSRYQSGGSIPSNWGLHRKFLSVIGNLVISTIFFNWKLRDWTTGYRAIRRSIYEAIHSEMQSERFTGYTFQIGFLHKAIQNGFTVKEVPFNFVDRTEGESKLGPEYIINTLRYIIKARIQEIFASRIFKFLAVGTIGFVVNFAFFTLFKSVRLWSAVISPALGPEMRNSLSAATSDAGLAVILGAEMAIISNYLINNVWTFSDRKITGLGKHLSKFAQFNLGSVGSIVIQYITMQAALRFIGLFTIIRIAGIAIESDNLYLVIGVLLGMIWNFSIYSLVIWRK